MSMEAVPIVFVPEEGTVWLPAVLPTNITVEEAIEMLKSLTVNVLVWEKKDKDLRLVNYFTGQVLELNAKVRDVIKPYDVFWLVWWPPKEEFWKPENQNDDIFKIIKETEEAIKLAPRSPSVLFTDEIEKYSIVRRLEREGKLRA
ncbi:hypothetical protein [Saccharolobus islandicus]|uniref:Uncharacterized protein n=2 Tax=Saccharolobus islandicus TaxID=43080 RepID=C4KDS8_SACI6|nr:hypothetical protein [Sulfolobus islandicus]ACR41051.1 conserved hypothetical protein [Sulfolobus islandicus M.16.4]ADX81794.1 conserved hypothetical protein [Sulfolobus islandicus HVE10/4]WCM36847.1 hypothetical protein GO599_04770 [Sulfolobus islandicus]